MVSVAAFTAAQRAVERIPESVGRGIFSLAGTVVGLSNIGGVLQLRRNYRRIDPTLTGWKGRLASAEAMRSYMRYYYEAFRLRVLPPERILQRVTISGDERLRAEFAAGNSVTGALMHAGNWDLAGAWAHLDLAPIHTIVEKLEPEEMFENFLEFRRAIGLTVYPLVRGGGALRSLERDMQEGVCFTPILADRDLASSGVEVTLAGHTAMVAPGPALLAQRLGCPIYPIYSSYKKVSPARARVSGTRWEMHLDVAKPVYPATTPDSDPDERSRDITRMTQEWVDNLTPFLKAHLTDWHMLQKVFVDDLDPDRLARTRAKARAIRDGVNPSVLSEEELLSRYGHNGEGER